MGYQVVINTDIDMETDIDIRQVIKLVIDMDIVVAGVIVWDIMWLSI